MIEVKAEKDQKAKYPLYFDGESVSGKVYKIDQGSSENQGRQETGASRNQSRVYRTNTYQV